MAELEKGRPGLCNFGGGQGSSYPKDESVSGHVRRAHKCPLPDVRAGKSNADVSAAALNVATLAFADLSAVDTTSSSFHHTIVLSNAEQIFSWPNECY